MLTTVSNAGFCSATSHLNLRAGNDSMFSVNDSTSPSSSLLWLTSIADKEKTDKDIVIASTTTTDIFQLSRPMSLSLQKRNDRNINTIADAKQHDFETYNFQEDNMFGDFILVNDESRMANDRKGNTTLFPAIYIGTHIAIGLMGIILNGSYTVV